MALPDSVNCKLFRAQEHLDVLQAETERYYNGHPAKVVRQPEGSQDEFIGKIVADFPIPRRIPLIVGDFLQNLRSCLDYLVWELVLAAKNNPTHNNMFPICTTEKAFNEQLARHRLDGISVGAIAEIEALQPYHDGQDIKGNVLFLIDDLCNINKHRRILTTIVQGRIAPDDFVATKIGDQTFARLNFDAILKQTTKIGPFPIVDGPFGRGPKVDMPLQLVAYISLEEGATKGVEIGYSLTILGSYVRKTLLPKFDRFFAGDVNSTA